MLFLMETYHNCRTCLLGDMRTSISECHSDAPDGLLQGTGMIVIKNYIVPNVVTNVCFSDIFSRRVDDRMDNAALAHW